MPNAKKPCSQCGRTGLKLRKWGDEKVCQRCYNEMSPSRKSRKRNPPQKRAPKLGKWMRVNGRVRVVKNPGGDKVLEVQRIVKKTVKRLRRRR